MTMSGHGQVRAQQRGIRLAGMYAARIYGDAYRQPRGRVAYFLGRKAVSRAARDGNDLSPWEGTAIVVAPDGTVVTVIKTDSPKRLRLSGARRRARFWN